jgi:hypothetical protein
MKIKSHRISSKKNFSCNYVLLTKKGLQINNATFGDFKRSIKRVHVWR